MNTVEINDKEKQLRSEAQTMIDNAKVEGRKLNEDETVRFEAIQKELLEVKENRAALDKQLAELNKEVKVEQRKQEINTKTNMSETKEFRLLSAINDIVNNRTIDEVDMEVIKRGRDQMTQSGQSYSGQIQLPVATRALDNNISAVHNFTAETYNGGHEAVQTDKLDILGGLYSNLGATMAGATIMTGLVGNVEIPKYSGTTVGWGTEFSEAGAGTGTFSSVQLTPKRLTAFVDISKQFLIQTSDAAEAMLRQDITNALSAELERVIFKVSAATTNAPARIATSATTIHKATALADWAGVIENLEKANFYGDFRVVISPALKADLRACSVDSGSGRFLFEDGELDGYPTIVDSNVEGDDVNGHYGFAGVFNELILANWGSLDLTVDPYSQARYGKVRIVVNAYVDAALRRDGAIKAITYSAN